MKKNTTKLILAAAALLVAGSAVAQQVEPPVAVNTTGLPTHVRMQVEEKAAQGQTALIQYLNRTRHIHNLRIEFIVKPEETAALAKKASEPTKMAGAEAKK